MSTSTATEGQIATTRTVDGVEVPPAGTYAIDGSHTQAGFVVKHLMISKVRGSFSDVQGSVTIADDPTESSVEVTVQTASVQTRDENRDGHLRSPDFFDSEQFPVMSFRSTGVTHVKGDRWDVQGELTIKDVTKPLTLEASFEGAATKPEAMGGGLSLGFSATGKINREEFGLTWNAPLETGGVVVGKDVTLEIESEAF
jgi:polyisoprenoid-binding protein YceI